MLQSKINHSRIAMLLAMAAGFTASAPQLGTLDFSPTGLPIKRAKAKPTQGKSNLLRGYYARYSNVLTEYVSEQNARKQAQRKTGFEGFRKVRGVDKHGNSVWVHAFWAPL